MKCNFSPCGDDEENGATLRHRGQGKPATIQIPDKCLGCATATLADPKRRETALDKLRNLASPNGPIKLTKRRLTADQTFLVVTLGLRAAIKQNFISQNELGEFLISPDGIAEFGKALDAANPMEVHRSWLVDHDE